VRLIDDTTIACISAPVVLSGGGRPIPALAADYPDLALLSLDHAGHVCVAVDRDWPQLGDKFQAYGFPLEGGSVLLTAVALRYSGKKGPGNGLFIDLASDTPVKHGMSGSPLFSLRTQRVCGIVIASHNPQDAHGGLAVGWAALGDGLNELLAASEAFHGGDRRWADAAVALRERIVFGHPHAVKHFTGREAELEVLDRRLRAADRAVITQAIIGLGGVGKTQLAARYVQCHGDEYDVVAWVRAEDGAIADLALLAVTLGLPVADLAPDDRAAHAVAWLTRCEQRWLLDD
jgi:hypothetical protein